MVAVNQSHVSCGFISGTQIGSSGKAVDSDAAHGLKKVGSACGDSINIHSHGFHLSKGFFSKGSLIQHSMITRLDCNVGGGRDELECCCFSHKLSLEGGTF